MFKHKKIHNSKTTDGRCLSSYTQNTKNYNSLDEIAKEIETPFTFCKICMTAEAKERGNKLYPIKFLKFF